MDLIGEYRDRLINGAELLIPVTEDEKYDAGYWNTREAWIDMLRIYREAQAEIAALGYTKNELQIAAATAIFDAVVEK